MTGDPEEQESESSFPRRNYFAAAFRLRWLFLGPALVLGLCASFAARIWPVTYRSEAMILLDQEKIPEQFITPNVIVSLQSRLETMKQQILSRSKLNDLIEQFGLYQAERSRKPMSDLIEDVRKKVNVELVPAGRQGDLTGIRISFAAPTAKQAQRVTMELVLRFIEESLKTSVQESENTTEFLESQLNEAHSTLDQKLADLREFKSRYVGELPEQEQSNLQILSSLQTQMYAAVGAMDQADREHVYYESIVGRAVADLQRRRAELMAVYTAQYPQVLALDSKIALLTGAKNGEVPQLPAKTTRDSAMVAKNDVDYDPTVTEALSRLSSIQADIAARKKEVEDLKARIQDAQKRLNMTAVRAQEFSTLNRAVEEAQSNYQSLLQKKLQSQLASNLEKKQQGDQFRVVDPASLPERAEGRTKILLAGWAAGIALGAALLVIGVLRDTAIREESDIICRMEIPVFEAPLIFDGQHRRIRFWRRVGEAAGGVVLAGAAFALGVQTYFMA